MNTMIPFPVIDVPATGKNIRRLRENLGYTVVDIQRYLNLGSPRVIYNWQAGKYLPSVDHLYAISVLFGVTMNEIIVAMPPRKPKSQNCQNPSFARSRFLPPITQVAVA